MPTHVIVLLTVLSFISVYVILSLANKLSDLAFNAAIEKTDAYNEQYHYLMKLYTVICIMLALLCVILKCLYLIPAIAIFYYYQYKDNVYMMARNQ